MNFEVPYVALPGRLTVRQNLTVFGRLYGVADLEARIDELVEDFELGDVLDRVTGRLSAEPEDPCRGGEGADQRSGRAALTRPTRVTRSRPRRMGAQPAARLSEAPRHTPSCCPRTT